MDQFEFENYIDKMKHRRQEGDFKTAARIAEKIDWEYVEDINLLVFAANIYENVKDYDSAKIILEHAYAVAPVKNRLYYALCSINIKAKDFKQAGNYYFDFCQSFPDDPRKQILKYYYLTARHADLEQRIRILEEYTEEEKDEEMLYELALLYEKIDNKSKMLETCDFIVDFFGVKKNGYGKDALLLKKKHTVLTDTEESLLEDYRFNIEQGNDDSNYEMGLSDRLADTSSIISSKNQDKQEIEKDNKEEIHRILPEDNKKTPVVLKVERENADNNMSDEQEIEKSEQQANFSFAPDKDSYDKNELENVFLKDAEQKEKLKRMIANFKEEEKKDENITAFNEYKNKSFIPKGRFENMKIEDIKLHMIIEANNKEEGVEIAKSELDYIHNVLNENVKVAKVTSYNVNDKGFLYYLQKLGNRDLIIENAGRLKDQVIDEIEEFIISRKHHNIISLVDVINNFDKLAKERPSFIERLDVYSVLSDKEQASLENTSSNEVVKPKEIVNTEQKRDFYQENAEKNRQMEDFFKREKETYEEEQKIEHNYKEHKEEGIKVETNDELMRRALETKRVQSENIESDSIQSRDKEMSVEKFVEFCKRYTKSIDCVMQGKTIPALYEKAEDLLEEGVRLTEANAIKLIEDAADRAEKPKLFNKPKYDKEGCLILTEDHFI